MSGAGVFPCWITRSGSCASRSSYVASSGIDSKENASRGWTDIVAHPLASTARPTNPSRPFKRRSPPPSSPSPRALQVVGAIHHGALREQAAAGLQRRHQVPAAVGVRGHVADQVVDAHALLDVDVGRRVQILAQILARLGIAQLGFLGQREHEPAGQVVELLDDLVVVRGEVVLADVHAEHARVDHARRGRLEVAARPVEAHANHLRVADHLGDGALDGRGAALALLLADEQRQTDQLLGALRGFDHAHGALPQPERAREHARHVVLAGQEHALPRHEHVVEDDEAFGHPVVRARRVVELVQLGARSCG